MMKKIVLGLSGGVDSAVAAHILKAGGYEVTGVHLNTGSGEDAEAVAESLDIGFLSLDVGEQLKKLVIEPFAEAYLRGETPNPCIMCNPGVKFPALIRAADELGAEAVATGHYAQVSIEGGRACLKRGAHENDQSYMLSGLSQEQLSRCVFPLGAVNKAEVRRLAEELGLSVAKKPDSMEICFIPDGDHGAFIESLKGAQPGGETVDTQGNVLGRHGGVFRYTVGQRRGLGVAAGRRMFVSALDAENNRVVLSDGDGLFESSLFLPRVNWISTAPPQGERDCTVRVRHSKAETEAVMAARDGGVLLSFKTPVRAPARGQTAAMYDGDYVLAAGVIE